MHYEEWGLTYKKLGAGLRCVALPCNSWRNKGSKPLGPTVRAYQAEQFGLGSQFAFGSPSVSQGGDLQIDPTGLQRCQGPRKGDLNAYSDTRETT